MSFRPVNAAPKQAGVGVSDSNALLSTAHRVAPHDSSSSSSSSSQGHIMASSAAGSYPLQKQNSNTDSQATALSSSNSTAESHRVFTPPIIERSASNGAASSGHESSQESQLRQLSQLAAVQEKMPDVGAVAPRPSVKRMADGAVKENNRTSPSASPPRPGPGWHSRNVSGVSIASSASSRVNELSSELKARLSYAMLKVHNGWQSRTIDEVENLASAAASPASSSNSTLPGPAGSSISPQMQTLSHPLPSSSGAPPQTHQPQSKDDSGARSSASPDMQPVSSSARLQDVPSLAPPVSIQPHRNETNHRRNSNPKHTPSLLSPRSHHSSPHTPALPSLSISRDPGAARAAAAADPVIISPTHNNREKDAMEALLFMSSPGNSANMKNYYPASQSAVSHLRNGALAVPSPQRTALPTSAPKRKSLPNGRPMHSSQPLPAAHTSPKKRVGFGRSPSTFSEMDIDDPATSPRRHATHARPLAHSPQKTTNGTAAQARHSMPPTMEVSKPSPQPKPRFSYEDLDKVLDQVAAEDPSSESESEIELPARRAGAGMRS
ncbi:hypothetical protein M406DRAFT_69200 [Cryphonectria parasitica EP155]|uniref:Uncharacterized protein n=1 Tax=Cryphonectria parasitica (strain ATCC 38755 / EP155) TaxID=660469 RepID=A0A9P5CQ04_CRYP1|nr:uncharacterized protein M406DRAFT_69200 [Cryphonectria parasitica EP155]KAF3767029.1 hypothetical protein M406DRAFT_69200 [Cryphonectria parasitica EP155]